jgi:2-polyprenyl-3-methyl-5-hydroxy-6-metoxy-1,4-benzoquinol methylase
MNLTEFRKHASERSGGTSAEPIKRLLARMLEHANGSIGSILDFGAGKGEFLERLHRTRACHDLTGIDLFDRPTSLPDAIAWHTQDLNEPTLLGREFDTVICSETIEHLENPRQAFRTLNTLLRPGGVLLLTMPNQESIRSLVGLIFGGHFTQFRGDCYPAHITALLRLDLCRICAETGFLAPEFFFTDDGGVPKLPFLRWQTISFGLLRGRWFSDNLGMVARKLTAV